MKVIVCGGRDFEDHKLLNETLDEIHERMDISCVVHGDARGADRMAAMWAHRKKIRVVPYPADWNTYGNSAGPIRNTQMLKEENPDMVIAFPGGTGTNHMRQISEEANVHVMVITFPEEGKNKLF